MRKTIDFANVYGFKPLHDLKVIAEYPGKISLTEPGKELNITKLRERFSAPKPEDGLKTYYEIEGMEMPDFNRMDYVERLQTLAEVREDVRNRRTELFEKAKEYNAKKKQEYVERVEKRKEAELRAKIELENKSK